MFLWFVWNLHRISWSYFALLLWSHSVHRQRIFVPWRAPILFCWLKSFRTSTPWLGSFSVRVHCLMNQQPLLVSQWKLPGGQLQSATRRNMPQYCLRSYLIRYTEKIDLLAKPNDVCWIIYFPHEFLILRAKTRRSANKWWISRNNKLRSCNSA